MLYSYTVVIRKYMNPMHRSQSCIQHIQQQKKPVIFQSVPPLLLSCSHPGAQNEGHRRWFCITSTRSTDGRLCNYFLFSLYNYIQIYIYIYIHYLYVFIYRKCIDMIYIYIYHIYEFNFSTFLKVSSIKVCLAAKCSSLASAPDLHAHDIHDWSSGLTTTPSFTNQISRTDLKWWFCWENWNLHWHEI